MHIEMMSLTDSRAVGEVIAGQLLAPGLRDVLHVRDEAPGAALEPGGAAAGDIVQVADDRGCSLRRVAARVLDSGLRCYCDSVYAGLDVPTMQRYA